MRQSIIPKWTVWGFLAVSFAGFLDAAYLTVKHYIGTPVSCSLVEGCETVLGSQYATIGNIPVALAGAIYYLAVIVLVVAYVDTGRKSWILGAAYATIAGFAASLWFLYVQIFVLRAICLYCVFSFVSATTLFCLGTYLIAKYREVHIRDAKPTIVS